jgi:hypothetical protein
MVIALRSMRHRLQQGCVLTHLPVINHFATIVKGQQTSVLGRKQSPDG